MKIMRIPYAKINDVERVLDDAGYAKMRFTVSVLVSDVDGDSLKRLLNTSESKQYEVQIEESA